MPVVISSTWIRWKRLVTLFVRCIGPCGFLFEVGVDPRERAEGRSRDESEVDDEVHQPMR